MRTLHQCGTGTASLPSNNRLPRMRYVLVSMVVGDSGSPSSLMEGASADSVPSGTRFPMYLLCCRAFGRDSGYAAGCGRGGVAVTRGSLGRTGEDLWRTLWLSKRVG